MKIVTQWMREEFLDGKLDNIPKEALEILKAEQQEVSRSDETKPAAKQPLFQGSDE